MIIFYYFKYLLLKYKIVSKSVDGPPSQSINEALFLWITSNLIAYTKITSIKFF